MRKDAWGIEFDFMNAMTKLLAFFKISISFEGNLLDI